MCKIYSSSRRLSSINDMIKCPRLSYQYPFAPKSPINQQNYFISFFISLPFLNPSKNKRKKPKYSDNLVIPLTLSPHSPFLSKIIQEIRPGRVNLNKKNPFKGLTTDIDRI